MTSISVLSAPLVCILVLLALLLFYAIRSVFEVSQVFREAGIPFSISMVSINFGELLKWASANNKKVAAIIFILIVSGILWTINFSS